VSRAARPKPSPDEPPRSPAPCPGSQNMPMTWATVLAIAAGREPGPYPQDFCGPGMPPTEVAGPDCPPGPARIPLYTRREQVCSPLDARPADSRLPGHDRSFRRPVAPEADDGAAPGAGLARP
jgi:hypothetical protein